MWQEFAARFLITEQDRQIAQTLFAEYMQQGYLRKTCAEMLRVSVGAIIDFYARLSAVRSSASPVQDQPHSGWMADADFCFLNVRATGLDGQMGNFIQAAKLLPALRVSAIHLGPFTSYDFACIYAVQSVETISRNIVAVELEALGFSLEAQLRAFVTAAHLLGMAVGFDLEPHTTQFAKTVIMYPEHFRWLKLTQDRRSLADGCPNAEMVREDMQRRITTEIRALVQAELHAHGLTTVEHAETDSAAQREAKDAAYDKLIGTLIACGYWTIPSQVWACDGIPAFRGYHFEQNYAQFCYLDRDQRDRHNEAYHITTPFKFYTNLSLNHAPQPDALPQLHLPTLDFFCQIFQKWRDDFDFDFVRYDSVDHIFDSIYQQQHHIPTSDRPTPHVLQTCVSASKSAAKPYIGNFAERMGHEMDEYAALGFDVMLGNDMCERITKHLLEKSFWLHDHLTHLNQTRPSRFAIPFAVDTHDTGNPFIWGEALVKLMGPERMALRHFVSRFISAGLARRPKYEVTGAQDLSYGLYQANVTESNVTWVGDAVYNARYHWLEDIYDQYKPMLRQASLERRVVLESSAWWCFQQDGQALIPMLAYEIEHGQPPDAVPLHLPLADLLPGATPLRVVEYDFRSSAGRTFVITEPYLSVTLPYLGFRLLWLERTSA